MTTLLPIVALFLIAWLWLDGARAREFATTLARRYCEHRGMQFLDDTVALARIGVRWTREGLRIRRMFRFEFSLEGVGRRVGHVLLLGTRLELIDDGLPDPDEQAAGQDDVNGKGAARSDERKVVPFRRPER